MRHLDDVAGRPHVGERRAHVVVDDDAARGAGLDSRRLGERAIGKLVQADDHGVAWQLARRGRDRPHATIGAREALEPSTEPQGHATLLERVVDRGGHVRVEYL